jgi:DtxR family Mn-dependent transcriptional regulator
MNINELILKGLYGNEKYGYIKLTNTGKERANALYDKHRIISSFFSKFLGVDKNIANQDACELEHSIHPETYQKIIDFFTFLETCPDDEPNFLKNFRVFREQGRESAEKMWKHRCRKNSMTKGVPLSKLKIGQKGKVLKIQASMRIRKHLLALGVIKGELIEVARVAPFGDPIDYKIKDYHLSLRKNEAECIIVEEIKK